MAETITVNYSWTKPDPGASVNTWGTTLNGTFDKIDAQVFINNNRGVEIGTITMFAGVTAPANWLLCIGQALSTTGTYAALFAVIQYKYGGSGASFNLPNLVGRFPSGAVDSTHPGVLGGEATHLLSVSETPVHSHSITDQTHGHEISQSPHGHPDAGHTHPMGADSHVHDSGWANSGSGGAPGGTGVLPVPGSGYRNTLPASTGITIGVGFANTPSENANIAIVPELSNLKGTNPAGGGAAHNNLPPYLQVNFIIKVA